jgi:hypothetical protein
MANLFFQQTTGQFLDNYVDKMLGVNPIRVRYNGVVLLPPPLASYGVAEGNPEGGFGRIGEPESLNQLRVTIPQRTLIDALGAGWKTAIGPYQTWEASLDEGATWFPVRTTGDPGFSPAGLRWEVVLIQEGIGESFL